MPTQYPKLNDMHVAEIYRAIALRFYSRYVEARQSAERRGGDLPDHGKLPSEREADDRYQAVADGCAGAAAQLWLLWHWARDFEWNEPLEQLSEKLLVGLANIRAVARQMGSGSA